MKTVITSYSNKLNNSEDSVISIENYNGVEMISVSPEHFQIYYTDYQKSKLSKYNAAFNLGYFAGFSENGKYFTLPVANLVADIDLENVEPVSVKYLQERHISDGKLYFPAILNASNQFKNKFVSTLVIRKNEEVSIELLNDVRDENILYAVSGAPIIKDGEAVLNYKDEGWDDCWTKAWNGAILPLNPNAKIQSSVHQNKPKRNKIPKKDKDKVVELFKQGKNRKEIAEICNIDYGNVCYIIRGAKVIR